VLLTDLITAATGGCGSNGSSNSGSSLDVTCLLGDAAQLSAMSIGQLRELLGKAAALSLVQQQQQHLRQRRQQPVP
jgi:hypothetical protein